MLASLLAKMLLLCLVSWILSLLDSPHQHKMHNQSLSYRICPVLLKPFPLIGKIEEKIMCMWSPKPFILALRAMLP